MNIHNIPLMKEERKVPHIYSFNRVHLKIHCNNKFILTAKSFGTNILTRVLCNYFFFHKPIHYGYTLEWPVQSRSLEHCNICLYQEIKKC